jgi:hypothetical protein
VVLSSALSAAVLLLMAGAGAAADKRLEDEERGCCPDRATGQFGPGASGRLRPGPPSHPFRQPSATKTPPGKDREEQEKQLVQDLERLLAQLRAAATDQEKQRLERTLVELVRAELRGTWLRVAFTLRAVDTRENRLRVAVAGTTLRLDDLSLAKDARICIGGREGRAADLRAGMRVTLQLGDEAEQQRVVGVRAGRGGLAGPAAAEIDGLIRRLGSQKYADREAASKALEGLGTSALEALTRAAAAGEAEVSRRAKRLLEALARREGTWHCSLRPGARPDPALVCSVVEADGKLYFINERGDRTEGTVRLDRGHIDVIAWGMNGRLEMDNEGTRIQWPNGSKWTQKRP